MRKWIIILVILVGVAVLGYTYIYQDHRNIAQEQSAFVTNTRTILKEFSSNPEISEQKYLNKTLELSGIVSEVNPYDITLDKLAFCQFSKPTPAKLKKDSKIKIKGRFIGYDDLLEQIKLDQCTIIN